MNLDGIDDVERLRKISKALMHRVESATDQQGNAFSLFQTAINLEGQVRRRTDELTSALHRVERVNHELALAKEAAETANLAKTRFLAAASHDVLQPLNAALLSVSVLADLQTTDQGRKLAAQVERTLLTMNELLGTLLEISRLDAGVMRPRLERIPIAPVLESLKADFGPLAARKGLQLRVAMRELGVESDRTMLRRILQNLVSNAIRYTSKGGVLVGVRQREGRVAIEIVDTGRGISPDHFDVIFEEFHRGPMSSGDDPETAGGLGLGLSIVRRMVSALGHELHLRSREMIGTRFTLLVPASASPVRDAGLAPEPVRPTGGLTGRHVLLLENDANVIAAMTTLLESWGCHVVSAATAGGAIAELDEARCVPDIVIADQHLDNGDFGSEAVLAIRARFARPVPAIVVTANPSAALDAFTRQNEMELMHKPVKPAQLRALLSHMVSARRSSMRVGG